MGKKEWEEIKGKDPSSRALAVSVVVNGTVFTGTNMEWHMVNGGCERVRQGCKSGQDYELCEGCWPSNHAEATLIRKVTEAGLKDQLSGATFHMYGHWWCCKNCCDAMESAHVAGIDISMEWVSRHK